jgi:hypothetical protein
MVFRWPKEISMKKLLILCAMSAIAANLQAAAGVPWQDITGRTAFRGATNNPQVAGALGRLLRAFLYQTKSRPLPEVQRELQSVVQTAAETGDFTKLDAFGIKFNYVEVGGVSLPEWIALAKTGHVPADAPKEQW